MNTFGEYLASALAAGHNYATVIPDSPWSDADKSQNICHYCTISTLKSIIEHRCLRFTDIRFLNDSTEFTDILRVVDSVLQENPYSEPFVQLLLADSTKKLLKDYRQAMSFEGKAQVYRAYTCSFSTNSDSLNMWNYYATSTAGLNAQFLGVEDLFPYHFNPDHCPYKLEQGLIIYNEVDKKKRIKQLIDTVYNLYTAQPEIEKLFIKDTIVLCAYVSAINNTRCFFKNENFSGEQEYRILLWMPEQFLEHPLNEQDLKADIKGKGCFQRGDVLIPYIDIPININAISKITLNPYIKTTASMMELGIRELFKQNSLGTINIVPSVIPLEKY